MPTYEYHCPKGHVFDVFQKMSDPLGATCPECGSDAERIIVPGEPEYEARARNLASGTIPLLRTTYDAVAEHIDKWALGIELPLG